MATEVKQIKEEIPCGEKIITQHFEDGVLVKQDVTINVSAVFMSKVLKGDL